MSGNPYGPPTAELTEDIVLKRSVWWKIYFFILTVLSAIGMVSYIGAEGSGLAEYVSLLSLIVATIGLFGFCFLKKILFPKFWMIFFPAYFLYGIAYLFISDIDVKMGMSDNEFYISLVVGYLISLPGYYALFSYGQDKNPIWSRS